MPLIRIDGRRVHVQEVGRGPTVVMVHGLVTDDLASLYFSLAPRLSDRRRVVLYDIRGHGRSGFASRGYDLRTLADDLTALVEEVVPSGEQVDLVGYSYGGAICLWAAMEPVPSVRRVAVVDAPLPPFEAATIEAFSRESILEGRAVGDGDDGIRDTVRRELSKHSRWDVKGRRMERWTERIDRLRSETTLSRDLEAEPAWTGDTLASLEAPILLVYGAESPFRSNGETLARWTPTSRLVLLPGDHLLPLVRPDEVAGEIERFLDG